MGKESGESRDERADLSAHCTYSLRTVRILYERIHFLIYARDAVSFARWCGMHCRRARVEDDNRSIDRQFQKMRKEADAMDSESHRQLVKALCDAGVAVESQEGKLAVYALAAAAREGSEGLKSFVQMAAGWLVEAWGEEESPVRAN